MEELSDNLDLQYKIFLQMVGYFLNDNNNIHEHLSRQINVRLYYNSSETDTDIPCIIERYCLKRGFVRLSQ